MVLPWCLVHQPAMYWKMSADNATSAARAIVTGLPLSSDSSSASSSAYFMMRSPMRQTSLPRSDGVIAGHGPVSNARRAADTARSTSSLSPSATRATTSPVAGLVTSNVLPDAAGTHLPSIKSCLGLAMKLPAARESPAISFGSALMASVSQRCRWCEGEPHACVMSPVSPAQEYFGPVFRDRHDIRTLNRSRVRTSRIGVRPNLSGYCKIALCCDAARPASASPGPFDIVLLQFTALHLLFGA